MITQYTIHRERSDNGEGRKGEKAEMKMEIGRRNPAPSHKLVEKTE